MKKSYLVIMLFFFATAVCLGQKSNSQTDIKASLYGFLQWYKQDQKKAPGLPLIKNIQPDGTSTPSINWPGVEAYLSYLKNSGYVSEGYLDTHRAYFRNIDASLENYVPTADMVKINGMDIDFVLHTYEPEEILDRLERARVKKTVIVSDKAIATCYISKHITLLFTLTKHDKKWLIDYLGYDLAKSPFGTQ